MGLISNFAAESSFGAYSFKNKCPINNRHRTRQGSGMKCDEDDYKGGECNEDQHDKWKTWYAIRSEVHLKMRNVRGFLYLHAFYLKERQGRL